MANSITEIASGILDPLGDGISKIQLLDHMGSDLSVVNDARKSFNQESTEMGPREKKLINYLIAHDHASPLRGVVFKFGVKAPLFVARQWYKHAVASAHIDEQMGWNEVSFRYVEVDPEFYVPSTFLEQSESNRQASGGPSVDQDNIRYEFQWSIRESRVAYLVLREKGVSREQARMVLPVATYTEWVWTASLQSVLNFIQLRKGKGAQGEIQKYANAVERLIQPFVPEAIRAWDEKNSAI